MRGTLAGEMISGRPVKGWTRQLTLGNQQQAVLLRQARLHDGTGHLPKVGECRAVVPPGRH
jgi:hypothetical protein